VSFFVTKISNDTKTQITTDYNTYNSIVITNSHATADITVDLYVTDQSGTNITDSGINSAEVGDLAEEAITTTASSSAAVHADLFDEEQVWKSDKTLFGACTSTSGTSTITFSAGLVQAMADAVDLYTGTRFYTLNNVVIPNGTSLKLEEDEIKFDNLNYNLYIKSDNASGGLDVLLRRNI